MVMGKKINTIKVNPVETSFGTFHVRRFAFGDLFKWRNMASAIAATDKPAEEKRHEEIRGMILYTVCDENGFKIFDEASVNEVDNTLAYELFNASLAYNTVTTEAVAEAKKD
jgi:hypothetical protein